jgi:nitroreductase
VPTSSRRPRKTPTATSPSTGHLTSWFASYLTPPLLWFCLATLGIARGDQAARELQMLRNYSFFDAPVGLLVTLDRRLNTGSFMDVGMFIQNVMVAARAQGLHTCAQAAFAWFHKVTRQHLPMGDNEMLLCGIALGHEDLQAPENAFITERAPLADFVSFHGMQACPDSPAR